ncbi:hypothetical protein CRYUN_Cryun07bG0081500 [Craigia yunnanensis]
MSPSAAAVLQVLGFLCLFFYILFYMSSRQHRRENRELPPGPRALPIIGNLHMLGKLPLQALHQLVKIYGPMMLTRLGTVPTVVVSSPQVSELMLKTHDAIFRKQAKTSSPRSTFIWQQRHVIYGIWILLAQCEEAV